MDGEINLLTLLSLVVAVVAIIKLRSLLGRRTEEDDTRIQRKREAMSKQVAGAQSDKVVTLPKRQRETAPARDRVIDAARDPFASSGPAPYRWRGVAEEGSALAAKLDALATADRHFDANEFLSGARAAYEMIVTGFAAGNREMLKPLLSEDVYKSFEGAIAGREAKGLTVDQSFIGIGTAKIADANLSGTRMRVTVSFKSELTSCTKNGDGVVVEGDPVTVREVTDVWTFERDARSRDPNWLLVATGAAAA